MTDSAHSNLKQPVRVLLVIFSIFVFYLFAISQWYWDCAAQIDPVTLSVACHRSSSEHAAIQRYDNESPEQKLWPKFGANNDMYNDVTAFWGDDIISNLFKNFFQLIASVIGPIVKTEIIPLWNSAMEPSVTRATLFGAIVWVLSIVGGEAIKDIYNQLKLRSK